MPDYIPSDEVVEAAAIAAELAAHPEARWDRFITYAGKVRVYGWLDRDDGRSDFLLLDFDVATGRLVEWITSAHPHPGSVVERLEGDESVECQRVEDYFAVPNIIRLSESPASVSRELRSAIEQEVKRLRNLAYTTGSLEGIAKPVAATFADIANRLQSILDKQEG